MKASVKLYFLILCLFTFMLSYAAPSVYVSAYHSPLYKDHKGYVVLNNSDTVYGTIQFNYYHRKLFGVLVQTDTSKEVFDYEDVNYVRLFDYDSSVVDTRYTEYRKLNDKPRLWRHIASGKIEIYDASLYCNEIKGWIDDLRILDSGQVINISRAFSFTSVSDLLHYTNTKHNTDYKRRDFKSKEDLLRFTADKG